MDQIAFTKVAGDAASERGCRIVEIKFDDDDNVFEIIIDKDDAAVDLADCEFVHRALLKAFDRDVEDYALTVSSLGIDAEEADELLKSINE